MSTQTPEQTCNALVAENAPVISRSMLVNAVAQALSNAAHNATFSQQQQNAIINTNTAVSAGLLHAIGSSYAQKQ